MDTLPKEPQKFSRFPSDSKNSRGWYLRLNKKAKTGESPKPDTKNIESLLSAVNSSSQHVRNFYVTFLLAGIYIAIIIWSTTDMMLLKETPVNLPLLNAKLPITGFYQFAPYFYLLIHFNLLLQLCLLSDKLHGYNVAISKLKDRKAREYYDIRLFPFAFSHTLSGMQHSRFLKFLLTTMVWITMIWLPLCMLIGLQVGFLAYHSEHVLELQRWAIVADLGILTVFWPIIRSPDGKWMSWVLEATGISFVLSWINRRFSTIEPVKRNGVLPKLIQKIKSRSSGLPMFEGVLSLVTLLFVIGFSWGVAVLPDSDNEIWVANKFSSAALWLNKHDGQGEVNKKNTNFNKYRRAWLSRYPHRKNGNHYFALTEYLFDRTFSKNNFKTRNSIFHRNLKLQEKLLIANDLKPEDVAYLKNNNNKVPEEILAKIVGLDLKGRDLRYANFTEALMPKVDFRKINGVTTKLNKAIFRDAVLFKANMSYAQLQHASLYKVQLQGANLWRAQLQGVSMGLAQLQGSVMYGAQLRDSILRKTQLQGTDLSWARMQNVRLSNAQLQGANLSKAQLQGADFTEAQLQGAKLTASSLQNANFQQAQLQGANLSRAELQNTNFQEAQLQGVNLSNARLQSAKLDQANLTLSNFSYANGKMIALYLKNPELLKEITDTMLKPIKSSVTLAKANGKYIMIAKSAGKYIMFDKSNEILKKAFKESNGNLEFAKSKVVFENKLVDYLIELSCQDKWVASGIINSRILNTPLQFSFAQCLLSIKDKKNHYTEISVCPGLSEISNKDTLRLKQMASQQNFKESIPATFMAKWCP